MSSLTLSSDIQRLVVLGDPHGDITGVEKIYQIESRADTLICCVGDVVGYADGPTSSSLCRFFEERGIPTVEGNHEDWVRPSGRLAIVTEGHDAMLDRQALAWIKGLPRSMRLTRDDGKVLGILAHSFRKGGWDWVRTDNAYAFAKTFGSPRLVLVGHSHRPKFITVSREGKIEQQSFDYRLQEHLDKAIPTDGTLLIDTGSIARPEATEIDNLKLRHDGLRFGTYAAVEIRTGKASLKRIVKHGQLE
jgi:hypothetical protein